MPLTLKCPDCRSAVDVPAGHDQPTINCGICWKELPVVADQEEAARPTVMPKPPAVAKGVAQLKVATLLPAGTTPASGANKLEALVHAAGAKLAAPAPKPVVAKALPRSAPAATLPTLPVSAQSRADDDKPKSKPPKRRDKDDDDDDDTTPRKSRTGALIGAIVAAGVLVVGLGVGARFIVRMVTADPTPDVAKAPANAAPNPNPVVNLAPPPVKNLPVAKRGDRPEANPLPDADPVFPPAQQPAFRPPPPEQEPEWQAIAGTDGLDALMPGNVPPVAHWWHVFPTDNGWFKKCDGQKYEARFGRTSCAIRYVDVPAGFTPNLKKIIVQHESEVKPVTFAGAEGFEFVKKQPPWFEMKRIVQSGRRVIYFEYTSFAGDADAAEKNAVKFFGSVKLAGAAKADDDDAAKPKVATAGKLEAFSACVALPEAKEFLAFGTRGTGGVLRRYAYPSWELKATYGIPYPVTYAAVDEGRGKLVVVAVPKPDAAFSLSERPISVGNLQVFDLKLLFSGKIAAESMLTPIDIPIGQRLAGLEGTEAGILALTLGGKAGSWKSQVLKLDTAAAKIKGTLDLPAPAWRLVADGRTAYAAEVNLSAAGTPRLSPARPTTIFQIDAGKLSLDRRFLVAQPVFDLSPTKRGLVFAAAGPGNASVLQLLRPDGATVPLTLPNERYPLGYALVSADGERVLVSPYQATGAHWLDISAIDGGQLPGVHKAKLEAHGGPAYRTPDGKFFAFRSGAILDAASLK